MFIEFPFGGEDILEQDTVYILKEPDPWLDLSAAWID
jgi:hypothetical protein